MKPHTKEKSILIRIDEKIYDDYKDLCKKKGYNMSQKIRNFIIKELEKDE